MMRFRFLYFITFLSSSSGGVLKGMPRLGDIWLCVRGGHMQYSEGGICSIVKGAYAV